MNTKNTFEQAGTARIFSPIDNEWMKLSPRGRHWMAGLKRESKLYPVFAGQLVPVMSDEPVWFEFCPGKSAKVLFIDAFRLSIERTIALANDAGPRCKMSPQQILWNLVRGFPLPILQEDVDALFRFSFAPQAPEPKEAA